MKSVIIAMAMLVGSSAFALGKPGSYGPNAYNKTIKVCYKGSVGDERDCHMMTYRFFGPRNEKVCYNLGKDGNGGVQKCYNRSTTGNYTYRVYAPGERLKEERGDRGSRN